MVKYKYAFEKSVIFFFSLIKYIIVNLIFTKIFFSLKHTVLKIIQELFNYRS